jgi:CheR methyltransferase, all-alpha domain
VTPLDYDFLRQALKQHSGLALSADKHYFLESRLLPLSRQAGLGGVGDLVLALKTGRDPALMAAVVEATTPISKNPGRGAGVSKYQERLQAGIFASSSDGSRST